MTILWFLFCLQVCHSNSAKISLYLLNCIFIKDKQKKLSLNKYKRAKLYVEFFKNQLD